MHQNLHPIGPFVGKYIGMMRHCLSKVSNDSGQGRIGPSTHIHWFYCQPDFIHANHVSSSRINSASLEPSCVGQRSEEHTSELQSRGQLVCRLLLEKKDG